MRYRRSLGRRKTFLLAIETAQARRHVKGGLRGAIWVSDRTGSPRKATGIATGAAGRKISAARGNIERGLGNGTRRTGIHAGFSVT